MGSGWPRTLGHVTKHLNVISWLNSMQRKAALMKRLVAANCDDVAAAYEEEIARISKERRLLQERCSGRLSNPAGRSPNASVQR